MKNNGDLQLITIGITCYNAEKTISRAINSAIHQKWPNTEIIIVDDCSADHSVAVITSLIQPYENIVLIVNDINQGPSAARQTILNNAKGEFIAFFDDDDESLPDRLCEQSERIISYEEETNQTLVACYASGQRIYPNGYKLLMSAIGSKPEVPHGKAVADRLLFFGQTPKFYFASGTPTCSLMARKSTIMSVGGFDPKFRRVEDVDLAIRIALSGGHFIGCAEILFTQYATDAVDKSPDKNLTAEIQLADKYEEYLRSVGRYQYAKNWPFVRYYHFQGQYFKMFSVLIYLFLRYPIKTASHFFQTGPKRFMHERKMKKRNAA